MPSFEMFTQSATSGVNFNVTVTASYMQLSFTTAYSYDAVRSKPSPGVQTADPDPTLDPVLQIRTQPSQQATLGAYFPQPPVGVINVPVQTKNLVWKTGNFFVAMLPDTYN